MPAFKFEAMDTSGSEVKDSIDALNDFERTAGLAGLDHVDVKPIETLGVFAERFGERGAAFNIIDDIDQRILEDARLHLVFENPQRPQDRQAGVLQRGELPGEGAKLLAGYAANGERGGLL